MAVTVGAPYYDFFAIVFGLPLVLLMGIGPLVAWRRASLRSLGASARSGRPGSRSRPARCCCFGGAGSSPAGLIGYTFAAFVLTTIVLEFVRGTRARKALGTGGLVGRVHRARRPQPPPLRRLRRPRGDRPPPRRRGRDRRLLDDARGPRLAPGESLQVGDYRLVVRGERASGAARTRRSCAPGWRSSAGDESVGTVSAGKNRYFAEEQTSNEVAIRTDWLRGEDLFVIADQFNADGSRVPRGAREPARQPHLARRARLRRRLARGHVARRARAAPPGPALRGGRRARARIGAMEASRSPSALRSRSRSSSSSRARSCAPGGGERQLREPTPAERERLRLLEERDRALAALKELEFDHRTGKVSDDDYRELVGPLRREAADALRALEREDAREPERQEADVRAGLSAPPAARRCPPGSRSAPSAAARRSPARRRRRDAAWPREALVLAAGARPPRGAVVLAGRRGRLLGVAGVRSGASLVLLLAACRRSSSGVEAGRRALGAAVRDGLCARGESSAARSRGQLELFRARRELAELEAERSRAYHELGPGGVRGGRGGSEARDRAASTTVVRPHPAKEAEIQALICSEIDERVRRAQAASSRPSALEAAARAGPPPGAVSAPGRGDPPDARARAGAVPERTRRRSRPRSAASARIRALGSAPRCHEHLIARRRNGAARRATTCAVRVRRPRWGRAGTSAPPAKSFRCLTLAASVCCLLVLGGARRARRPGGARASRSTTGRQRIDQKIAGLRDQIEAAKEKEGVLTGEIDAAGAARSRASRATSARSRQRSPSSRASSPSTARGSRRSRALFAEQTRRPRPPQAAVRDRAGASWRSGSSSSTRRGRRRVRDPPPGRRASASSSTSSSTSRRRPPGPRHRGRDQAAQDEMHVARGGRGRRRRRWPTRPPCWRDKTAEQIAARDAARRPAGGACARARGQRPPGVRGERQRRPARGGGGRSTAIAGASSAAAAPTADPRPRRSRRRSGGGSTGERGRSPPAASSGR